MKGKFAAMLLAGALCVLAGCGGEETPPAPSGLWDFAALSAVSPEVGEAGYSYAGAPHIRAIYFMGQAYRGEPTRVFAYLGLPEGEAPSGGYPGVVLVHGGLGRAYPDWVKLWTDRGYAAISLSVDANITDATNSNTGVTHNPEGGPGISITAADLARPEDSWEYISVANVILAHNLLRGTEGINPEKIGITGISWGSYLACIALGVDGRFAFGAPVYGAGFMDEDVSSSLKDVFAFEDDLLETYRTRFDPSAYLVNCRAPLMWFAGADDHAFAIDCTQRCADLNGGENFFSWRGKLPHGQQPGDGSGLPEIFAFADRITGKGGGDMAVLEGGELANGRITAPLTSGKLTEAVLYWSDYPLEFWHDPGNNWRSEPATVTDSGVEAAAPEGALFAFIEARDEHGYVVSTRCFAL